jgi:CBS domain-containing protein
MAASGTPIGGRPQVAADIMTPSPRSCSPFSTVIEAVMIFRDEDCGAVPVVDAGKPVGILTDRDVALALAEHPDLATRSVSDIMTKGVISVPPATPLGELETIFGREGVRRLLVVDRDRLVGIVSWADLSPHTTKTEIGEVVSEVVEQP